MWDILGFGVVAVDDLIYLDRFPEPDTKVPVRARRREGGGLTGTALVAAARLGARVAYGGILGEDELSVYTIRELEREGVDCAPVLRRAEARPCHSLVLVDQETGRRTILFSAEGVVARQPEEMPEELIRRCRLLFIDYTMGYGGLQAVRLAHAHGIEVVADVERLTVPGAEELLHEIDHLIVGVDLARQVTGESEPERMVRALQRPGRACCAVTAGERGCWYAERGAGVCHVPAYQVEVVDTTGCGDVFHGAYAAALARGSSVPAAIRVAAATAALKATRPGGRSGIPDWATVERFLAGNQASAS
jgi:sugar/nucleoside kinase (ribokinase family)